MNRDYAIADIDEEKDGGLALLNSLQKIRVPDLALRYLWKCIGELEQ